MLEELGKRIAKAGQSTVQKTREFAEEVRINNLISEKMQAESRLMLQLGNAYYESYVSSPSPELSGLVRSVTETRKAIEEYREQIRKLKNIAACPRCGMEIPYDSVFCAKCGVPVPKQEPAVAAYAEGAQCSKCGGRLLVGATFCNVCGTKAPVPLEPKQEGSRCPSCGAAVLRGTEFCAACGKPLPAVQAVKSNEQAADALSKELPQDESTTKPEVAHSAAATDDSLSSSASWASPAWDDLASTQAHRCPHCGNQLIPDAAFCLSCGKPISAADSEPSVAFCLGCGEKLLPETAFCLNCGQKV